MNNASDWYQLIEKPFFAPPPEAFGIAWSILYPIIFLSFGYVCFLIIKKKIPAMAALPFGINLVANFLFSPLQFLLQNNVLATIDIFVVLLSLLWCIVGIWKYSHVIALVQIPYLLWVSFATVLQVSITWLNF